MKKIILFSAIAMTALVASAQETVVKDAEKAMKSGKSFEEVSALIQPATQDASTSGLAITYYIPGKTAFKDYDDMLGKRQFGMYKQDDPKTPEVFHTMAKDLIGGYDYFIKALSLDTVVDAKGKTKTKYSKEIVGLLKGHYPDYSTAGLDCWNVKDFENAYRAWEIYLEIPNIPALAKDLKVPADSVLAEVMYNQAIAAWQMNDFAKATQAFKRAAENGYSKDQLFQYGAAVASAAKDLDGLKYFAMKGSELYPENDEYINLLINYYLGAEKYDEALTFISEAIQKRPENAQYHALQGIIYDNKNNLEEAMKCYEKALQLNPENPIANLYYGLAQNTKAGALGDSYNGNNYDNYKQTTLVPILKDAAAHLEKAYELDKNIRSEALKVLELVYYNLDDAAGQESVKQRKLDLE